MAMSEKDSIIKLNESWACFLPRCGEAASRGGVLGGQRGNEIASLPPKTPELCAAEGSEAASGAKHLCLLLN